MLLFHLATINGLEGALHVHQNSPTTVSTFEKACGLLGH